MNHRLSIRSSLALLAAGLAQLAAADSSVRLAPQLMVGTAGLEIGVAVELRSPSWDPITIRPELLFNNDERLGGGVAALWSLTDTFDLPDRHDLGVGPRLVYHNSDDDGLELSALGIWSIALGDLLDRRHSVEVLAAVGVLQDRENDDADPALSVGAAYAYRF